MQLSILKTLSDITKLETNTESLLYFYCRNIAIASWFYHNIQFIAIFGLAHPLESLKSR